MLKGFDSDGKVSYSFVNVLNVQWLGQVWLRVTNDHLIDKYNIYAHCNNPNKLMLSSHFSVAEL